MAQKVVEVPGVGLVEFPDKMDDAAIGKAIQAQLKAAGAPPTGPKSSGPSYYSGKGSPLPSKEALEAQVRREAGPGRTALIQAHDIVSNVSTGLKNIASSAWESLKEKAANPIDFLPIATPNNVRDIGRGIAGTAKALVEPPVEWGQAALKGDAQGMSKATGRFITETAPAAMAVKGTAGTFKQPSMFPAEGGVNLPKPAPYVDKFTNAFGGKSSFNIQEAMQKTFTTAGEDLRRGEWEHLRRPVTTQKEMVHVVKNTRDGVWTKEVEPYIKASGEVELTPVAEKMIAALPEDLAVSNPELYQARVNAINKEFAGKTLPADVVDKMRQRARAEARSILVKNNFDRMAAEKTLNGQSFTSKLDAISDTLTDHVKSTTGIDIKPAMKRYGALSDIEQNLRELAVDPTFFERLTGGSIPLSRTAATAKGIQSGAKMFSSLDSQIAKAFKTLRDAPPSPNAALAQAAEGLQTPPFPTQPSGTPTPSAPPPPPPGEMHGPNLPNMAIEKAGAPAGWTGLVPQPGTAIQPSAGPPRIPGVIIGNEKITRTLPPPPTQLQLPAMQEKPRGSMMAPGQEVKPRMRVPAVGETPKPRTRLTAEEQGPSPDKMRARMTAPGVEVTTKKPALTKASSQLNFDQMLERARTLAKKTSRTQAEEIELSNLKKKLVEGEPKVEKTPKKPELKQQVVQEPPAPPTEIAPEEAAAVEAKAKVAKAKQALAARVDELQKKGRSRTPAEHRELVELLDLAKRLMENEKK